MSTVRHQFVISSQELARWLDSQPGTWWFTDGDYSLIGKVHFPCPNDELADTMRPLGKNLMIYTEHEVGLEDGRVYKFDNTVGGPPGVDNVNFWNRIDNVGGAAPPWGSARITAINWGVNSRDIYTRRGPS